MRERERGGGERESIGLLASRLVAKDQYIRVRERERV